MAATEGAAWAGLFLAVVQALGLAFMAGKWYERGQGLVKAVGKVEEEIKAMKFDLEQLIIRAAASDARQQ